MLLQQAQLYSSWAHVLELVFSSEILGQFTVTGTEPPSENTWHVRPHITWLHLQSTIHDVLFKNTYDLIPSLTASSHLFFHTES